jgi:flavin reductase (DIM6/NTAB) family NADH-FMN oxidoreductase RutF
MTSPDTLDPFVGGLDYPMFVVTTATDGGDRAGCLIGFATQSSIDPPRLLVCLSKANHTYRVARDASLLAVHRLGAGQHELAALFGSTTGDEVDKFARCAWQPGPGGVPLLADSPGRLVGEIVDRFDVGDHVGFLLAPLEVSGSSDGRPLSFSDVQDLEPGHPA